MCFHHSEETRERAKMNSVDNNGWKSCLQLQRGHEHQNENVSIVRP